MSRLGRLLALPRHRQALLLACAWALLQAAWRVRRWPFARLAATLGKPAAPADLQPPPASAATPRALDVRWAVAAWARAWPWRPSCLMQAVAARRLLASHGVACDIVFGVRAQPAEPAASTPEIGAHAWLICGSLIVTGETEAASFQPIAVYRFSPGGVSSLA